MGRAIRWFKGLFGLKIDSNSSSGDGKSRLVSCFGHSGRETDLASFVCHNPATIPPNISPAEAIWLSSFYTDKEQSKHAIAVAAASAAAADAAVTAAQAAAAVVRLTSGGKDNTFGGGAERFAAVRIQTFFRGYLARKALRALKGLVKIQALVRGFLVRKQATETLKSMQALIRAQATVRSQKVQARMSMERFDDGRREHLGSIRGRRLSVDPTFNAVEDSPKIVEVDTGRPKSRSRRTDASISGFSDDPLILTHSSPFPYLRPPCRTSVPEYQSSHETECFFSGEECRFSTAQNTPRFMSSVPRVPNSPATPSRSVCGETLFRRYGDFPNYMANTKSFRAKLRSYSAPKQRPEPEPEPEPEPKKKVSLKEMMESRSLRIRRSKVGEAISFKNAVMGNLDRSGSDFGRETERYSVSGNIRDMVRGSPGYIHNI